MCIDCHGMAFDGTKEVMCNNRLGLSQVKITSLERNLNKAIFWDDICMKAEIISLIENNWLQCLVAIIIESKNDRVSAKQRAIDGKLGLR